ncbi:MAG: recombination protein RecO [Epsilonproteobacteria bacterium]|nr:recombination protein RecO [Campylobacterota bacterium]
MQGYILNINRVKDEDLIVSLLSKNSLKSLYRFYGARHGHINIGYKVDYEAISSAKTTISMLRNVLHLGDKWMVEPNRFFVWQQFIKLLYKHLKDVEEIDNFYFNLLDEMNQKFAKQNPTRVVVESYVMLLAHEGRLHDDFHCLICEEHITSELILTRSYLPAHQSCIYGELLNIERIKELFTSYSTLYLSDKEVSILWKILQEGF